MPCVPISFADVRYLGREGVRNVSRKDCVCWSLESLSKETKHDWSNQKNCLGKFCSHFIFILGAAVKKDVLRFFTRGHLANFMLVVFFSKRNLARFLEKKEEKKCPNPPLAKQSSGRQPVHREILLPLPRPASLIRMITREISCSRWFDRAPSTRTPVLWYFLV